MTNTPPEPTPPPWQLTAPSVTLTGDNYRLLDEGHQHQLEQWVRTVGLTPDEITRVTWWHGWALIEYYDLTRLAHRWHGTPEPPPPFVEAGLPPEWPIYDQPA